MSRSTFADGLVAAGPAPEYRDALMLYGQFVGDWTTVTTAFHDDGSQAVTHWEARFEWVLEGRAIQDLWFTPPRHGQAPAWHAPGRRYGTTMRTYDPTIEAWHIVWFNPPSGTIVRQLGRRVGDEIVQIGAPDERGVLTRWVFRDIDAQRFRWCNETSADQGRTWRLVQEMRAQRSAATPPTSAARAAPASRPALR